MTETTEREDETAEDWFGIVVDDNGAVWGISADGEQQWDLGRDEQFYRDLIAAGFPLQCDSYRGAGDGHLFVDFGIKPSLLPLCHVTAYSQGPAPREHDMGEAGAVVHRWLEQHPDIAAAAAASSGGDQS